MSRQLEHYLRANADPARRDPELLLVARAVLGKGYYGDPLELSWPRDGMLHTVADQLEPGRWRVTVETGEGMAHKIHATKPVTVAGADGVPRQPAAPSILAPLGLGVGSSAASDATAAAAAANARVAEKRALVTEKQLDAQLAKMERDPNAATAPSGAVTVESLLLRMMEAQDRQLGELRKLVERRAEPERDPLVSTLLGKLLDRNPIADAVAMMDALGVGPRGGEGSFRERLQEFAEIKTLASELVGEAEPMSAGDRVLATIASRMMGEGAGQAPVPVVPRAIRPAAPRALPNTVPARPAGGAQGAAAPSALQPSPPTGTAPLPSPPAQRTVELVLALEREMHAGTDPDEVAELYVEHVAALPAGARGVFLESEADAFLPELAKLLPPVLVQRIGAALQADAARGDWLLRVVDGFRSIVEEDEGVEVGGETEGVVAVVHPPKAPAPAAAPSGVSLLEPVQPPQPPNGVPAP